MDKWPAGLKQDMEEIFKSSPELLEVLNEEKEFEDLISSKDLIDDLDISSDEPTISSEKKDKD